MRKGIVFGVILILLLGAIFTFKLLKSSPKSVVPAHVASVSEVKNPSAPKSTPEPAHSEKPASQPITSAVAAKPFQIQPDLLSANQLVDEMTQICSGTGPITPEQAARFKQDLKELIRRGAASVPAIQEFLKKDVDASFADVNGGDQLGYSSLRASMIDALSQIGGPEAQAVMLDTMQTTAVPSELLELAGDLDQLSPGQYHDQIVAAAQETLDMASANQLGTNTELGPAFHTLQTYGNGNTTSDLANNDPLQFYSAVEMANMPDGQGLDSLVQMEKTSTGDSKVIATEMIAQLAGQNADALDTLAQMAQNGQIGQDVWVKLAPILGGNKYQIDPTGQNYSVVGGAMTPGQISQRIEMINALMNFVPPDSAAAFALKQELGNLNGKMSTH